MADWTADNIIVTAAIMVSFSPFVPDQEIPCDRVLSRDNGHQQKALKSLIYNPLTLVKLHFF